MDENVKKRPIKYIDLSYYTSYRYYCYTYSYTQSAGSFKFKVVCAIGKKT